MATPETDTRQNGATKQRRPFSQWVRRLANLKEGKKHHGIASRTKKSTAKNNPYPESTYQQPRNDKAVTATATDQQSFSDPTTDSASYTSVDDDDSPGGHRAPTLSNRSAAPTVATNPETVNSDTSHTKGGASRSQGGGGNSTFSSPNHSERSLTTTLATIQSTAASGLLGPQPGNANGQGNVATTPVQFAHQYPVSPASAIPPHLAPHPHTYHAATANGVLSDDASILTLASSSKRRRRHSFDTDASVRALAPSSVWGGSRESLPLSILSDKVESGPQSSRTAGVPLGGYPSAERASVYSSSGAQPDRQTLGDNRSSYHAGKGLDGVSIRSGKLGHGRSESITGSIGGVAASSPLASPTVPGASNAPRSLSRRSSDRRLAQADEDGTSDVEETKDTGKAVNQAVI